MHVGKIYKLYSLANYIEKILLYVDTVIMMLQKSDLKGGAFLEYVMRFPKLERIFGDFRKIQSLVFFKSLTHVFLRILLNLQKYIFSECIQS